MFKSKVSAAMTTVVISLGIAGAANALTVQAGDYLMVLQNLDSATLAYGNTTGVKCASVLACDGATGSPALGSVGSVNASADTMGIFSVQSITQYGEITPYWVSTPGDRLTGVFGNLMDHSVSVGDNAGAGSCTALTPGGCTTTTRSIGGAFAIWTNAAGPDPLLGPSVVAGVRDLNALLYPTISNTGTLYLSGSFAPGAIFGDLVSTFGAHYINGTTSGGSAGYLDFSGGSALALFNTNGQIDPNGGAHDAFGDFTFSAATGGIATAGWTVTSVAQVYGTIPEPGSLALLALALLGVGAISRRNQA